MGIVAMTVSDAQRHGDAVKRYQELGGPDVSQREALRLWKAWEAMSPPNRSRARRAWCAQRQAKRDRVSSMHQGFEASDHLLKLIGRDLCK
jgi:hypothetical protein